MIRRREGILCAETIGKEFCNTNGDRYTVTEYLKPCRFRIRFLETGFETTVYTGNVTKGQVKDHLKPSVCGVGIFGYADCDSNSMAYAKWYNMLSRCYNPKDTHYSYYGAKGVTVCERWQRFDYFILDITNLEGYNEELFLSGKLELDKDKKQTEVENKVYSPETCCLITGGENKKYRKQKNFIRFIAISPNGEDIHASNVSEFCRLHGLDIQSVYLCLRGKRKQYKGWRFEYLQPPILDIE